MTRHTVASVFSFSLIVFCSKTKLCGQNKGHPGTCNKKGQPQKRFWEDSPYFKLIEEQGELTRKSHKVNTKEAEAKISQENLAKQREELDLHETSVQERIDAASKYYKILICDFLCQYIEYSCPFVLYQDQVFYNYSKLRSD